MSDLAILSFNSGELTPLVDGRPDIEKYYSGYREGPNMIPTPYGPAERRPGTKYVAELKDNSKKARLIPFQYSTEQAYILEFGDQYIRFYKDRGQITTGTGTEDLSGLDKLVAHWLLNDNLATQAVLDDNGNTHDGTTESANTEDLNATGKVGTGCFDFDGVEAVSITQHADFEFNDGGGNDAAFSLAAWIYVTNAAGNGVIISKWDTNSKREWVLFLTTAQKIEMALADQSESAYPYRLTDNALSNGWHFVVGTYDGGGGATAASGIVLYVDGVAVDSTATEDASYVSMENGLNSKVMIGAQHSDGTISAPWPDRIDNVAVFSDVLTATEVASLYTSTGIYEISDSYLEADLFGIQRVQSADVLFSVHGGYMPTKLLRYAHDDWAIEDIAFDWPPFLDENITDITITPSGAGAAPLAVASAITLTASAALFTNSHIGSYWLIKHPRTADETVAPNKVGSAEADGFFNAAGEVTGSLKDVKGSWRFRTAGTWTGEIVVERSYDSGTTWHTVETFTSEGDLNFNVPGEEEIGDAYYRARAVDPPGTLAWANEAIPTLTCERYYHYGIVKVTAFTSATVVTGEVVRIMNSEVATKLWSEGAWSDERGFPATIAFFEGRQFFAGTSYKPLNIWGSKVNEYDNFRSGTLDDDPVKNTIDSGIQNKIRWLVGQEVLLIGTSGAEWKLGSADPSDALSPSNPIKPRIQTTYGSKEIQALLLANAVLFVDTKGRRVRGAQFVFEKGEAGAYDAPDYTQLAEHITDSGIVDMAYQQNPDPILWCVRDDGVLIGMVFEPGQRVWGWFRCVIDGLVESVAVIPGVTEDEVWIIVKRTINGATKRYIEYFMPRDWGSDQADCFFVDSGLSFDGGDAQTITNITKADPAVVTVGTYPTDGDGNNLADGDQVKILGVAGMTEVNNKVYTISNPNVSAKTFELRDKLDLVDIDSTDFTLFNSSITGDVEFDSYTVTNVSAADIAKLTYGTTVTGTGIPSSTTITTINDESFVMSNKGTQTTASVTITAQGTVMKVDNTFSGLDHLEAKTVSVLGDGSVHADVIVSSGSVTLTEYYNKVHIGLPFVSSLKPMKLAVPGASIRGKKKRIHQIIYSFYKTLGAKFGTTSGSDTIPFRKTTDAMGLPPPLFTGEKIETFPGGFELDGDIFVEQTQPLPMTVRSITPRLEIYK
jgi:hypothetical protein